MEIGLESMQCLLDPLVSGMGLLQNHWYRQGGGQHMHLMPMENQVVAAPKDGLDHQCRRGHEGMSTLEEQFRAAGRQRW